MTLNPTKLLLSFAIALAVTGCSVQPVKMDAEQHREQISTGLQALFEQQEVVSTPISLAEAIARAIKYNLDRRVKLMEQSLADRTLEGADIALLPELVTNAGYSSRNNYNASSSVSLSSGNESLEPSYSTEKSYATANISLVWNILDFGVSYVQAQQDADRVLIARERRRKVTQNIAQDVRYAYWRAVAAQHLLPQMDQALVQVKQALADSHKAVSSSASAPIKQLNYQRALLETQKKLWTLRESFTTARTELATLMNLQPGTEYTLAAGHTYLPEPVLQPDLKKLEVLALEQRPELREENYQYRISVNEVKKSMLRMLPGLEISLGQHYNSNRYLHNDQWGQAGINLSWNLFNLLNHDILVGEAEAAEDVAEARRLSMGMAVLAQLHLAYQRYQVARESYAIARQLREVNDRLYEDTSARVRARNVNPLALIGAESDRMAAQMHQLLAFAELENAYMRINNSAGIDILPQSIDSHDLKTLTEAIAERL